jgi:MFS transporter, FHS family, glucose/mannose:H+ symporter
LVNNNIKNYLLEFPNYLSMFLFSFFMMLSSPILVDMGKSFSIQPESMNLIITYFLLGEIAGMLTLVFLIRKFSQKIMIILVYILLVPAATGLMLVSSLTFFYILYFAAGFGLGIIFMNSNLSMLQGKVKNKESVVNLGHGFFAMGALVSPFIASSFVKSGVSWRFIYIAVIVLAIACLVSYIIIEKMKKASGSLDKKIESTPFREIFKYKKRNIYMLLTAVLMLFYVMSEVTIFSWAPTFFRVEKLFDIYSASLIVSIFWVGILAGRLLISVLSYKYKAGVLLIALSAISLAGLALVIFPAGRTLNFAGAGLVGLGFSGIPPLLISSGGKIFGADVDVSLTTLFVIGIASGSFIPYLIKVISSYSFIFSMIIAIIFMALFFIFVFVRKAYRKTL